VEQPGIHDVVVPVPDRADEHAAVPEELDGGQRDVDARQRQVEGPVGVGVNIDYRTKTRELEDVYGHKPQGIYTFVRIRS